MAHGSERCLYAALLSSMFGDITLRDLHRPCWKFYTIEIGKVDSSNIFFYLPHIVFVYFVIS